MRSDRGQPAGGFFTHSILEHCQDSLARTDADPNQSTRDQLISGSLDAQYVEIRGLVIATRDDFLTLLTADGILDLEVNPAPGGQWAAYLNSIIRVRGCLTANWDVNTHRIILDQPQHIHDATVS